MSSRGTAESLPPTVVDCHIISSIGYWLKPFNMDQFRHRKVMIKRKCTCNECAIVLWKILGECLEMYHHVAKTMRSFNNGERLYFRLQISYPKIDMPCEIRGFHGGVANCTIFEDWSTTFLRNVRNHLRNDTVSHSIRSELLHHAVYCGRSSRTFQESLPPSSEYMLGGGLTLIMKTIEFSETQVFLCGTAWNHTQKAPLLMSVITSNGSFVRTL
jgi:hypothetical protein